MMIRMLKIKRLSIFIFLAFFLSGCWDIDEADRMNYVHGVGIDYVDGEIVVYLQIPNMGSLGSPDVASETERSAVVVKERGENISSIIHHIYQSAQRKLYFGHNTFIVLTEEALKNNLLNQAIDLMNRFPQTRYRVNIFATQSDVEALLHVTTLFEETSILTRITDLENTYELSSFVDNISMRELIIQLDEPGYDGIIPAITLNEDSWRDEKDKLAMIETVGVALIKSDEYCGFILDGDVKGLRWLQRAERNAVTVFDGGRPISEIILVRPKHDISLLDSAGKAKFEITVHSRGIVTEVIEELSQDEIVKSLKKTIENEIRRTYLAGLELDSDVYRLSEEMYRYNFKKWKEIEENGGIPLDEDSITVKVKIDLIDTSVDKLKPTIP